MIVTDIDILIWLEFLSWFFPVTNSIYITCLLLCRWFAPLFLLKKKHTTELIFRCQECGKEQMNISFSNRSNCDTGNVSIFVFFENTIFIFPYEHVCDNLLQTKTLKVLSYQSERDRELLKNYLAYIREFFPREHFGEFADQLIFSLNKIHENY